MSSTGSQGTRIALAVLSVLVMAYSLIIAQQILLGLLVVAILWLGYVFYQFIRVLSRIATSLEQLVEQQVENSAEGWDRTDDGR
ncbi:hypothetical protein [Haloarcula onubensis]|uniref:Uncharacterized protein n=1 Tax=Haloarcula onubensis TaxID=2950539 RepID=A0ABU2FV00_9EURY|nr:hypothetical protein [Halomicroarcula sp. S3CR25-11]MDS0284117.1 hypothetical protein [Halomicroarcula sp. S3CR25-11]